MLQIEMVKTLSLEYFPPSITNVLYARQMAGDLMQINCRVD